MPCADPSHAGMNGAESLSALPRVLAETPQIIDPPQYSIAWLVLAALCVIVILALVIGTLRITRRIVERAAYRRRPSDVETLKAEFLRAINDIGQRHDEGALTTREAHRELTGVMRRFVRRTTGYDVTSQDVATLQADDRTRDVGLLIADLYEPDFSPDSERDLEDSLRRARQVVRRWS